MVILTTPRSSYFMQECFSLFAGQFSIYAGTYVDQGRVERCVELVGDEEEGVRSSARRLNIRHPVSPANSSRARACGPKNLGSGDGAAEREAGRVLFERKAWEAAHVVEESVGMN